MELQPQVKPVVPVSTHLLRGRCTVMGQKRPIIGSSG
jgi:hypothetical protein